MFSRLLIADREQIAVPRGSPPEEQENLISFLEKHSPNCRAKAIRDTGEKPHA